MNPAQQEQLINIGAYLRDLRKEKGATVDEVANQIFIRPALVRAIETGDWESLPEPVFVQGFIRRYAEYLELNGQEIAQKFEPTPVAVLPDPLLATSTSVEGIVKQQDKHGLKVLSKADAPGNGGARNSSPANRNPLAWLAGLLGLAALAGLVLWLATRTTPQSADSTATPATEDTVADEPTETTEDESTSTDNSEATAAPAEATEAGATDPTPAAPVVLSVDVEQDAWMRITVDGSVAYEGIMTAGSTETWTADSEIRVTAGNSGGVLYSFNGSDEQRLGAPGTVSNLTLTPDTNLDALPTP